MKKPKPRPKPETECFYFKGNGHWKRNCPKYLADNKDGKVNKSIYDIHVYFTSVHSSPWVFDTGSVAMISNLKQELQNEQRLVEGKVTMCVGSDSKVDKITISHTPFTFRISVEPKINVIWCLRWAWIWLDHVYCNTVIHLSQRIIGVLFTW